MRRATILRLALALFAASVAVTLFTAKAYNQAGHTRRPVTVTYVNYDPDGSVFSRVTVAFRSDGSKSEATVISADVYPAIREVWDLKAGYYLMIDPHTRLWVQAPYSRHRVEALSRAPATCEQALKTANAFQFECGPTNEQRFGRAVHTARMLETGKQIVETLSIVDPSLDWLTIDRTVTVAGRKNVSRAVSVLPGEPDAALFAIPQEFQRVAKLSTFMNLIRQARALPDRSEQYRRLDKSQEKAEAIGPLGDDPGQ
jgi:hypothetical protein